MLAEENFVPKLISVCFDECHTLVDWGTFRPMYNNIPELIVNLSPDVAYHMVTATCNDELKDVILKTAGLQDCQFEYVAVLPNRYTHLHPFML
jgi:superfamily II DNA helicase RecQ